MQGVTTSLCLGSCCIDSIKAKQHAGCSQHSLGHLLSDLKCRETSSVLLGFWKAEERIKCTLLH